MKIQTEPVHPVVGLVLLGASVLMPLAALMPTGPRAAIMLGYLLLAPGYAVLPSFGRQHWLFHGLLALCVGIALAVALSTAMSETGWWHVQVGVVVTWLLVVSTVGWRMWRNHLAPSREAGGLR